MLTLYDKLISSRYTDKKFTQNIPTSSLQRSKIPPTCVMDMTLLMLK